MFINQAVEKVLNEIAEVAGYLWQKGWAERNAGNISVNITGLLSEGEKKEINHGIRFQSAGSFNMIKKQVYLMTGTGTRMRDIAKCPSENICIVTVNEKSQVFYFPLRAIKDRILQPTSETDTHLAIQQMLLQTGGVNKVVLHAHVTGFIALTQIKKFQSSRTISELIWKMHPEAVMFCPKGLGYVPYMLPGSPQITKKTVTSLLKHDIIVWGRHGGLAVAPTLEEAFDTIDLAAKSIEIFFTCRNAGFEPDGLSQKEWTQIRRSFCV